jgi:small subunit ribosomal protein S11
MAKTTTQQKRKKKVTADVNGKVFVKATFNNVMVTITDVYGNTLSWSTAGRNGFRGSRKNTPYAAQVCAENAAKEAYDMGLRKVDVFIKGPGSGREAAIRTLQQSGLEVLTITDTTPLPHNGCRPPKRRRV